MNNRNSFVLVAFILISQTLFAQNKTQVCFDSADGYDQSSSIPNWSYKDYVIPLGFKIGKIFGGFERPNYSTNTHDFIFQYCPNTDTYDPKTAISAWDYGKIDSSLYNKWIDISDLNFKSNGMVRVFLPTKNGAIWNNLCFSIIQNMPSIWFSLDSTSSIPKMDNKGTWNSSDQVFAAALNQNDVISVEQALANSRKPLLKKVLEVRCNGCDVNQFESDLKRSNSISGIVEGPNYQTLFEPNDYNLEFAEDYALDLIDAKSAWDVSTGNSDVVLAISDQNFYSDHEELVNKWVYYDTNNVLDKNHGTAVAITAAGNTDNNLGKSSIGFNCNLALYRMNYNELLAASYAGYRVINASWVSSCFYNYYAHQAMIEIIENGSIVVAAAGNGGTCGGASSLVYPAAYEEVLSVTSIGPNDNHERTIGDTTSTHQHNNMVDLSAPGYDIALSPSSGYYTTSNGTSFAAPLVSGTIGLMLSKAPCLTVEEIESILKSSADTIDHLNSNYAGLIGVGRLNSGKSLQKLINYPFYSLSKPDTVYSKDSVIFKSTIPDGYKCEWQQDCGNGFEIILEDSNFSFPDESTMKIQKVNSSFDSCTFRCIVLSDSFDCKDTSENFKLLIIDTVTNGMKYNDFNISILPNPVNDELRINGLKNGDQIYIHSSEGHYLKSFDVFNEKVILIPMVNYASGVYFLSIERKGFSLFRKKIIHH